MLRRSLSAMLNWHSDREISSPISLPRGGPSSMVTNTGAPVVSGLTVPGSTLTTTTGSWDWAGSVAKVFEIRWKLDGTILAGQGATTTVANIAGEYRSEIRVKGDDDIWTGWTASNAHTVAASGTTDLLDMAGAAITDMAGATITDMAA